MSFAWSGKQNPLTFYFILLVILREAEFPLWPFFFFFFNWEAFWLKTCLKCGITGTKDWWTNCHWSTLNIWAAPSGLIHSPFHMFWRVVTIYSRRKQKIEGLISQIDRDVKKVDYMNLSLNLVLNKCLNLLFFLYFWQIKKIIRYLLKLTITFCFFVRRG